MTFFFMDSISVMTLTDTTRARTRIETTARKQRNVFFTQDNDTRKELLERILTYKVELSFLEHGEEKKHSSHSRSTFQDPDAISDAISNLMKG